MLVLRIYNASGHSHLLYWIEVYANIFDNLAYCMTLFGIY